MKRATLAILILMAAAATLPATATAALRAPQVPLSGGNLQDLMNSLNPGTVVTGLLGEQEDIQRWTVNLSGTLYFKLLKEAGGVQQVNTGNNVLGLYNSHNPYPAQTFAILPKTAVPGWYATGTFDTDDGLVVSRFDENDVPQGQSEYVGVNRETFSYFVENDGTKGLGQDFLNPFQQVRVLVFAGKGINAGGWFLCFEDGLNDNGGAESQDFDDAIVFLSTVNPATPALRTTWGSLKSRFR